MGPGFEQIPRIKSVVLVFICFYIETGGLPLEYKSFLSKVPRLLNRETLNGLPFCFTQLEVMVATLFLFAVKRHVSFCYSRWIRVPSGFL